MRHRWAGYILAVLLGLALTVWLFPRWLLFPANYYDLAAEGDTADHIIGQRYFLLDQWHMPPLQTQLLRWPKGTNIAFTDSIPLLAIPAKLLRRILPPGFHAIFWFLAIAWCLQPVAAVFALRGAGEKRLLPSLAVAVIALSMPTLLYRSMGHEALCGHFLILLAIGTYFRISHGSRIAMWLGPPALLVASLLVHPYLMAMVAAVLVAAPISLLVRRQALCLPVSVALTTAIGIAGGLALLLGYAEEAGVGWGYGYYSMNLLSPIDPAGSTLIPFFPVFMDATGGQYYEGYQYLGAGVLLLCLIAVISICRRAPIRVCARHSGLLIVSAGLILFALSNSVYNGQFLVFHFESVPRIFQSFRSSGRFFWPVAYLLVIGSIATVVRRLPGRASAAILLIAAALQFADATALRNMVHDHLHRTEKWYIDRVGLGTLMQRSDRLTVWPRYECQGSVVRDPQYLQVLLLASQYRLRTNTMYTPSPRFIGPCRAVDVIGTPLQAGELRIILPAGRIDNVLPPSSPELCHQIGNLTACAIRP